MLALPRASHVCRRPVQPICPISSPLRKVMVVRHRPQAVAKPLAGPGVSKLAAGMEPFAGCNCYYLLEKSIKGMLADSHDEKKRGKGQPERDAVWETLRAIKGAGFNVVRIWAFNDWYTANEEEERKGREEGGKLQMKPGVADSEALKGLDWLVDEVEKMGGIKLMMTLTNCVNDYGGMQQYVRWAKGEVGPGATDLNTKFRDPERFDFYTNDRAKQYYENYVKQIVNRYKDRACIHSWDICNEPRDKKDTTPERQGAPNNGNVARWVHDAAGHVKSLDPAHPVTVGSEGFFWSKSVPSVPNNWQGQYPFSADGEGCDWLLEGKSPNIDFVCIHPYGDQWRDWAGDTTEQKLECNKKWIECHLEACKTHLGGKPLVLQEFNMPRRPPPQQADTLRVDYYDFVKGLMLADNPLIGSMMWMVAHEGYAGEWRDPYTLYPSAPELNHLCVMNREINNRPRPSSASTMK